VFNNRKITLNYSVYICTSGEKVRKSDEAERVQPVSYPHKIIVGVRYIVLLFLMPTEKKLVKQEFGLIV